MSKDKSNHKCMLRGGYWSAHTRWCRSTDRRSSEPNRRDGQIGFRLAKTKIYPRTTRGGSWYSYQKKVHCAYREAYLPRSHNNIMGFRLARSKHEPR